MAFARTPYASLHHGGDLARRLRAQLLGLNEAQVAYKGLREARSSLARALAEVAGD